MSPAADTDSQAIYPVFPVCGDLRILFFPVVSEVVLHEPGLAIVVGTPAELPLPVGINLDELEVALPVMIGNFQ
jgi:hypothetical protein